MQRVSTGSPICHELQINVHPPMERRGSGARTGLAAVPGEVQSETSLEVHEPGEAAQVEVRCCRQDPYCQCQYSRVTSTEVVASLHINSLACAHSELINLHYYFLCPRDTLTPKQASQRMRPCLLQCAANRGHMPKTSMHQTAAGQHLRRRRLSAAGSAVQRAPQL